MSFSAQYIISDIDTDIARRFEKVPLLTYSILRVLRKGKLSREEAKMWEDEKVEWTDLSSVRARSDSALTLTLLAFLHQRGVFHTGLTV